MERLTATVLVVVAREHDATAHDVPLDAARAERVSQPAAMEHLAVICEDTPPDGERYCDTNCAKELDAIAMLYQEYFYGQAMPEVPPPSSVANGLRGDGDHVGRLIFNSCNATLALSNQGPVTSTSSKDCLTCKAPAGQGAPRPQRHRSTDGGQAALAMREACGVYTLGSCGRGLRCVPPEDEARPLQALLDGRGVCSESNPTTRIHSVDPAPNEPPENTPCRKLLNTVMRGLEGQLLQSLYDIYIPNCDKRGFFKKKQCRSSKGAGQRGSCWCVDENGTSVTSSTRPDGTLVCEAS
ncbi:Insulin-like growth factor-binding protein 6 [Merluccius polli]|uniref:Insulin-like growth factor-binding protein 6 n=1 Tax=Merluccius polli TaxID=89951 RepID=A0AA47M7L7_MERPO|nr:Insulin-like growth factor-binding protein 6 [Merluccius polli]